MLVTRLTKENILQLAARQPYDESLLDDVAAIVEQVKLRGDAAVLEFADRFDGFTATDAAELRVSEKEISAAVSRVSPALKDSLAAATGRVREFHEREKPTSWFITEKGAMLGQKVTALDRAGLYVPGGRANYPSTVIMNVIPAQVAGVSEIAVCTPPGPRGNVADAVLAAADILGITEIYKVGGAQAVAAMAFGTATIKRVDKITGPGNAYVTLAKKLVTGQVGIDMLAGPSEIVIVADDSAEPGLVAWDLLAQAEHDPMASAILVTTSERLATAVQQEIDRLLPELARRDIAEVSLAERGQVLFCDDMDVALAFVNEYAPEHLEMMVGDPTSYLGDIRNAGAIFLGRNTPEALGDYIAGANHTLPTGGTARFSSPLGVEDFIKRSSVLSFSPGAAGKLLGDGQAIADAEGLTAHSRSLAARQGKQNA